MTVHGTSIEWGLKNEKLMSMMTPAPEVGRYPDAREPNARQTVQGLAANLGGKAVAIASSVGKIRENFAQVVWEFETALYPKQWWEPALRGAYNASEAALTLPWSAVVQQLQWECPVPPGYVYIGDTPLPLLCLRHTLPSLDLIHDRLGHLITVNQYICMNPQPPEPAKPPPPPPQTRVRPRQRPLGASRAGRRGGQKRSTRHHQPASPAVWRGCWESRWEQCTHSSRKNRRRPYHNRREEMWSNHREQSL